MSLTVDDYRKAVNERKSRGNHYHPEKIVTYEYWGQVVKVVDGDTVDFRISLGFDCQISKRCRLFGINAPEYYSSRRGTQQRADGKASMEWLAQKLPVGHWIELRIFNDSPHDKYGRWLVEIWDKDVSINELIVEKGHADFQVG